MSVHYKFKSALESDTVTFDGLHISLHDLKNSIMQQKRIGRNNDFDLQVTNAETKEVYVNEDALIPKNTSLLIARVPSLQAKPKVWEGYGDSSSPVSKVDDLGPIGKAADLSSLDASEEDKIKAMMSQSTQEYDPSNYIKIRGSNQVGTVPPNYRCYKCHQMGHWIKDCTLNQGAESMEIKKSTGIPRSFMVAVEGPQVQGAMITPSGSFAVPALDHQAYTEKPHPAPPPEENKTEIPEDLVCSLCSDLLTDAVMIPCCGDSYCDECIRSSLLESEDHECPACHERDISPGTLIPNRYLRNSVANFKSTTGYVKRLIHKQLPTPTQPQPAPVQKIEENIPDPKQEEVVNTEPIVAPTDDAEIKKGDTTTDDEQVAVPDETKNAQEIQTTEGNGSTRKHNGNSRNLSRIETGGTLQTIVSNVGGLPKRTLKINERSPRRHFHKPSPTYQHRNERGGTPTVDEPGITAPDTMGIFPPTSTTVYQSGPPPNMGMMGMPPPVIQPPPPSTFGTIPSYVPPNQGAMPPNYRMPLPGATPFVPGGYPPRPVYDMGRVPAYPPVYQSGSRGSKSRDYHRDYSSRRGRSPPNAIIDDPLEAFNRMLREKDERERRAKQRKARSYSRSSSRSVSHSPPRKGHIGRSPRRRSRSRSYSISRSRSRSFSPGLRISPTARNFSPKRPHRKIHARYQSPGRSPQRYRFKDDERDHRQDRQREQPHGYIRDGDRAERDYRDSRNREFKYYDGFDRSRGKGRHQWNGPRNPQEQYYQAPEMAVQQPYVPNNRYPPQHDVYPPLIQPPHHTPTQLPHIPPNRSYEDDVVPPGTEQPPVPGLENAPSIEERYQYTAPKKEAEPIKQDENISPNLEEDHHRHDKLGGTPERKYYSPPPRKQDRDREYQGTPEKHHKRRRHDDDRKRDISDDERSSRRNKDKKKKKDKREKKEEERKKRRERKEKREQERLNKKNLEQKEKSERKLKKDVVRHDAETQATNDKDEENDGDRDDKYQETTEVERLNVHYEDSVDHDDKILQANDNSHEAEDIPSISPRSEKMFSPKKQESEGELYGDLLTEEIDNNVVENYGKLQTSSESEQITTNNDLQDKDEGEITDDEDEADDSEKDILELHTNEAELKMDIKSEVLAPLPERSKWEVDEDVSIIGSLSAHSKLDRTDKFAKVSSEVLKRAENAIFAKAINAIRPIEIKKISMDRAKLYSGERDNEKSGDELREEARNIHITITGGNNYDDDVVTIAPDKSPPKVRLSVKERLGCKVDELDRIVKIDKSYDRNRSHSLSPLSRRSDLMSRNLGQGERRFDLDRNHSNRVNFRDRNRNSRQFRNDRDSRRDNRSDNRNSNRDRRDTRQDRDRRKDDNKRHDVKSTTKIETATKKKSAHTKSSSEEKDRHKKRDKRDKKKEKTKRLKKDNVENADSKPVVNKTKNEEDKVTKMSATTDKRKPTLDEASFEPDYDLETESEKDDVTHKRTRNDKTKQVDEKPVSDAVKKRTKTDNKRHESSSSESSESSSEDDRKRRKHRKHKKRRNNRDSSSSSSSETESESSNEDKDKHKKRHKKKLKKKKKPKHK